MLTETATAALVGFSVAVIVYFALWNASQMAMSPIALLFLARHRVRHRRHVRALAARLVSPPLVSVIVPSYNEELTIVESVRALLALDYATREIIVVNDGSSDGTLAALHDTFQLVPAPAAFAQPLKTAAVRGMYRSTREPALVVVDKVNGGSQIGRGERRVQCGVRDARAEHRRRYLARARRVEPGGDPVPRRPVDRRGRRQHRDQQRLPHRERPHHGGRAAAKLAGAISDRRVHAGLPAVPAGVRRGERRGADLGRVRPVSPRRGDCRWRLRPRGHRRGHGSHDPAAAALPRARRADPNRIRSESARLDPGAGRLAFAEIAAVPVAPRPAPGAVATPTGRREPTLRRRRARRAALHSRVRGTRPAARDRRVRA